MGGVAPVRSDTVLTPPVGAFDPNTGHIAVKVLDRDALPQDAAIVSLTGPQNKTLPTNSDGCAFFAFLPAGTYTVQLATTGYVDRQSNPTPTQTLGVTIGAISSVQFDYDAAATIQATFVPTAGGTVPADLGLVLANTQYLPSGTRLFPGTGAVRTVQHLFPALEGFVAWAGECADADPEGIRVVGSVTYGPYWPGATRPLASAPASGETIAVDVAVPTATVQVVGAAVAGATVRAVHAADSMCSGANHVLGTTDAGGNLTTALPYGHWTIQVDGHAPPAAGWPELVVDPTAATPPSVQVVYP
jgi:hypothetical protein